MLTISLAKCLNATKNGSFKTADLKIANALTYDDMIFLAEYLKITPLTELDLSIEITAENISGLKTLSKTIGSKRELAKFRFAVEQTEFHLSANDNIVLSILNYFTNRMVRKMNGLVHDAMVNMVKNKPSLEKLNIDLEAIETPASSSHAYKFSRNLQNSPLKTLDLNFKVEKNAELPILDKSRSNDTLVGLKLHGLTFGSDILRHLQHTHSLRVLAIDNMIFNPDDIPILENIFKSNASLSLVALTNTNIGQIDNPQLLASLKFCPKAAYMDLSGNNLSRWNIDALCTYLSNDGGNLIELDLSGNAYMPSDAKKLANSLLTNNKLTTLAINGSYIEDEGLQAIIELLKSNKHITSISMSKNCRFKVSDETVKALCALLTDPECQLEELNFVQNISLDQLEWLCNAILDNTSLISVNLNYLTNTIMGVIYKIKIQEHVDGLSPLVDLFISQINKTEEEQNNTPEKKENTIPNVNKVSVNLEDGFFPNKQADKTKTDVETPETSPQPG